MGTVRRWLRIAGVVMIMTGCSSSRAATTSVATDLTVPLATPSGALAPTTAATTAAATTTAATTTTTTIATTTTMDRTATTVGTVNVITRPYVDPVVCGSGAVSASQLTDVTVFPFAVGRLQPIPLQVLASSSDGVAKPFAVVLRFTSSSRSFREDHYVDINGTAAGITMSANGNAAVTWVLHDGTRAYMRSRGLDEAALVGLVTRLTPRDPGALIPGFDLQPSADPNALVLLHEHLNTGLSGTVTTFVCQPGLNQGGYRIVVLDGDPVFVYFGIIDRPFPYAVGVNGNGAITITNSFSQTISLEQVTNADPATWAALPAIGQPS